MKGAGNHLIHVASAQMRPARRGPVNCAAHGEQREPERDVARVDVGRDREREGGGHKRRRERPLSVRPADRPEQGEHHRAPPDEPGHVPRQQCPGREQRQKPGCVDVRQERTDRVIRVAPVEPDPDARPVGARIDARSLAPRDEPGREEAADHGDQEGSRAPRRGPTGPSPGRAARGARPRRDAVSGGQSGPPAATPARCAGGVALVHRAVLVACAEPPSSVAARRAWYPAPVGSPAPDVPVRARRNRHRHRRREDKVRDRRHPEPLRRARRRYATPRSP